MHNVILERVLQSIEVGDDSERVVGHLWSSNNIYPHEGWLWDYKRDLPNGNAALCEILKSIQAFYNSYGGYIFFGVEETIKDKKWQLFCKKPVKIDASKFRNLIKEYLTNTIDIGIGQAELEVDDESYFLSFIRIPKRPIGMTPSKVRKKGAGIEGKRNKYVFMPGDMYFRRQDECLKAIQYEDVCFLVSTGRFLNHNPTNILSQGQCLEDHNLPDKNTICPKFFGRKSETDQLWFWLTSQFEYTKMLVGDGGKGKTSVALNFCQQLVSEPPSGFDRVLWLSAKRSQFYGFENDYKIISRTDFHDPTSLLTNLSKSCGLEDAELHGLSTEALIYETKQALSLYNPMVIIDDIDSLEVNDQTQVVSICTQLADKNCRFLITSRRAIGFARELCIEVKGMSFDDFKKYITFIIDKYSLSKLRSQDIKKLYEASNGSPLFGQSILRLSGTNANLSENIHRWKGELGEDVRSAALKKEIEELSKDAQRTLYALSRLNNCGDSELKLVVGLADTKFIEVVEELRSLFLIEAPLITAAENRYSISQTTSLTVQAEVPNLLHDAVAISREVKRLRSGIHMEKRPAKSNLVGHVISTAAAQERSGKLVEALETVDAGIAKTNGHADLWSYKGQILYREKDGAGRNLVEARKCLEMAYQYGNRYYATFECLFNCYVDLNDLSEALECCENALKSSASIDNRDKWLYRKAFMTISRWRVRQNYSQTDLLHQASKTIRKSIHLSSGHKKAERVAFSVEISNLLLDALDKGKEKPLYRHASVIQLIQNGDKRTVLYERCFEYLKYFLDNEYLTEENVKVFKIQRSKFRREIESRAPADLEARPMDHYWVDLYQIPEELD